MDRHSFAQGREAEIFAWEDGRVLRLFREPRSDEALQREADAMRAAHTLLPNVPEVYERHDVDGRPGLIMQRLDGADLLTIVSKKPWTVWRAGRITGELQARLHDVVAPPSLPSLKERIHRLVSGAPPEYERLAAWVLRELDALPDGDRICHGDLHPGNILQTADGPYMIDWPNATRGAPEADFARSILMMRMGSLPPGSPIVIRIGAIALRGVMRVPYERAYRRGRPVDMALVRRWMPVRAADRLTEGIEEERDALLRIIERAAVASP